MKFGKRSLDNLKGIHPDLVKVLEAAIVNSPVDFTITGGIRTTAEQQALYAQGRTKAGSIVTYCDGIKSKSNHQIKDDGYGYAVDLYPYYNGSVQLNDVPKLKQIADHIRATAISLSIDIIWGGDFTSLKDYPHFELK
jgi:peptidoglycan L-alanyl-D-glutamate endopeptidase CwlK